VPQAELRRDLEVMERETRRLQQLIEDLFTLSRAEVGALEMRCEPIDVGALVRRVAETVAPLAWRTRRLEVVTEIPDDLPPARADETRLEQVLRNLVRNSTRHTPPGGIIALTAAAVPDGVTIEVRYTGYGIAPDDLPHIWERFYRADNGRAHDEGGAGLGLALVKELTEAMGGTVAVNSTPGEGSCFRVTLPRA
jgi:signal transduction histidine kinase